MTFDQLTEPLDRRLSDGLARLAAVARQLDWQAAESAGLSPTQADILRFVANRPEGARLTAAAAHVGIRKATASDAVTTLETKSLLRKQADATDGRAIALKATAKGTRIARKWPASFRPIVAGLSESEQEILLAYDKALEGYRSQRFPDGAVITFDLLEAMKADNAVTEGQRKVLGVMHKDAKMYAATGGWGFEGFGSGDPNNRVVGSNGESACFVCHLPQESQDYTFSRLRD